MEEISEEELTQYFNLLIVKDEDEEKTKDENVCKFCNKNTLNMDYTNGCIVCYSCGVINSSNLIDESAEWNYGHEDSMYGKDPSRCGGPINPLLEKSSMSTIIGKGGGNRYWLLRRMQQQHAMDYVERSRWHTFEYISQVCERYNIPQNVINTAKEYYKEVSEKKLTRGAVRKGLIACCVMYASRHHRATRSVKEIAKMFEVDTTKINSSSKLFDEFMKPEENKATNSQDLITRFCCCLHNIEGLDKQKLIKEVKNLNEKIEKSGILIGKTPSAITSAMIFYTLVKDGYIVNKKYISSCHGISVVTINKIFNIIESNI